MFSDEAGEASERSFSQRPPLWVARPVVAGHGIRSPLGVTASYLFLIGDNVEEKELFWCAGFLEGEGSFTCHAFDGRGTFSVEATQTSTREPLDRLQQAFGGNVRDVSRTGARNRGTHSKDSFIWTLHGHAAVKVVNQLLPLMSQRRQVQIINALARLVMVNGGNLS